MAASAILDILRAAPACAQVAGAVATGDGGIDGILGTNTREAVRQEQARLGLPVDGWPTPALLANL